MDEGLVKQIDEVEQYARSILSLVDTTERTLGECVELAYCREQIELALSELAELRDGPKEE